MFADEDAWYNSNHAKTSLLDNNLFVGFTCHVLLRFFSGLESDRCSSCPSFADTVPAGRL
jgi:hypothetical protein